MDKTFTGIYYIMGAQEFASILENDKNANFSFEGALKLYEIIDNLCAELDEQFEFDKVAIRSEYYEYDHAREALEDINRELYEELEELYTEEEALEEACFSEMAKDRYACEYADNGHLIISEF